MNGGPEIVLTGNGDDSNKVKPTGVNLQTPTTQVPAKTTAAVVTTTTPEVTTTPPTSPPVTNVAVTTTTAEIITAEPACASLPTPDDELLSLTLGEDRQGPSYGSIPFQQDEIGNR